MIDAELYARIRRLFFAEHWKVGTIVAELGVHHDTVEHAIEADRFVRAQRQFRSSLLDPYKPFLGEVLEGVIYIYRMPIQKHFRAIGHSLFALVFAIIGGVVGQCFSRGARLRDR